MRLIRLAVGTILFGPVLALARVGGGDVTFDVPRAGNVVFSHDVHVTDVGLPCTQCHDKVFVTKEKRKHATMKDMQKGKSCGACHDGKKAFSAKGNCNRCHKK